MNEEQETVLPLPWWAVVLIVAFCWPTIIFAEPRFVAEGQGVTITLHDTPCELDAVKNLPFKATWQEGKQTFNGCWGPRQEEQTVVAYFDDKTIALIPFGMLKKAQSA